MILFSVHGAVWMNDIISKIIGGLTDAGCPCVVAAWDERAVDNFRKLGHRNVVNMVDLYRKHDVEFPNLDEVRSILKFDWPAGHVPEGMQASYEMHMIHRCAQAHASVRYMLRMFNPESVVIWNNLSFGGSLFDKLANPKVRRMFIERGLPNTIQFSVKGVNADLDLAKSPTRSEFSGRAKNEAARWLKDYFDRKSFAWPENIRTYSGLPKEVAECKKPIVLWASQVAYDTQIVRHSPFGHDYSKVYDLLSKSWDSNGPMQLVIKLHPQVEFDHMHDKARQIKGAIVTDEGDIRDYLSNPNVHRVATVNSTVGFEALLHGIPTATLGENWYTRLTGIQQSSLGTFLNTAGVRPSQYEPWPAAVYLMTQGIDDHEFYSNEEILALVDRISWNAKGGVNVNSVCDAIEGRDS
jgi:hypothetical protein